MSITSPDNGDVFLINTPIPIAIEANEGDESIITVEVFNDGSSVGFASSLVGNQYEFVLTETGEAGLQRLTAVATDELGNSTTSEEVNILLSSGASPATVLNTVNGVDPAVDPIPAVDLGSIVTLGITASDDGNVTQVEVFNGSNSIGLANLVGVNTYRFDYQASSPGLLNLQVRSTDDLGNIGFSDLVPVSVITGDIPTANITSPANGNSIKSGETLEITVDADDLDGFITSVEVFNNAVSLGLANPTGAANEFLLSYRTSAADLGNLNLQARSVDNQGNVGYSAVIAYSVVQGVVPTVSITSPDNGDVFLINTPIPIAIEANEGDESIITVEVFNDGSSVGFASSLVGNQYEFVLTETGEAGLQRLTAVATDELGNSTTSEEVNILLSSGASPATVLNTVNGVDPAVDPIPAVDLGSIVTLGITASDDGNVTQVEVFNGSNSIGLANLVGVNTYRFDYQASSPGLLNLQVRSTDDLGNIGFSDLVPVSVITGDIPTANITSPANGNSIKSGETLEITVDADDLDGFITSVEVFNNAVSLGLANPTGAANEFLLSYRTSAADLGNLNLQARSVDNQGNVGYSAVIAYSVVQGVVPEVSITSPDNGDVFLINTPIPIAIEANEGDESIITVEVFNDGSSVGFASSLVGNQYEFVLTETGEAGLQRLTAVATDELGNSTTSEEVNILLSSGASPATVLNTVNGVDPAVDPIPAVDLGSIVTLGITASDDGNVTQVEVFNGSNSIGLANLVGVNTYRFDYQASSPGLLNLQVRSTDDLGNIGFSDLVPVSVITGDIPTANITSPANGNSIKSGETLEITVDADDLDGFITSVEVFNNAVSLGLANPTGAANEFLLSYRTSAADLGNLNLQARSVDNQGNVGYSAVIAYSVVQGVVPEVSITSPDNGDVFLINTPIPIAIEANEGDESIITVEVFNDGSSVGFASSLVGNQYEFVLTETGEAGLQRLTAVATDELGNSTTSEEVNILLSSGASPATVLNTVNGVDPAVDPIPAVDLGSIVTLGITASDDGNVTQVEVFNGSNSIGLANLVGVNTYRFDYQASSPGLLNLQVRSTDDLGNIGFSDLVPVSVITGDIPTANITSPANGNSIKSGETLEITVDADDLDGFITSVEVFNNAVSLGLANPTGAANEFLLSYRTSAADLGNLNLQARSVDNQGNVGYSAVIAYSVVQGVVPEVSITSPDNGDVFLINTPIPIAIEANEGDESIITVEVFNDGSSVGFASSLVGNQYEFVLTETGEAGLQRLTAVATDELGNSTTSEEVNILLSSGASPATVLNTVNGVDPAVDPIPAVDLGSIVTLGITASDDGNVTQVEVFNGSNSIGLANLVGVNTYRFDYQASSPGLLNLQVRSTDDLGNIGFSDLVPVSVIAGVVPTITIDSPGTVSIFNYGNVIPFEITASDPDGSISSVRVEVLSNGTSSESNQASSQEASGQEALKIDSVDNDQYRYFLDTAPLTAGTKLISVSAVDNRGNVSIDVVEIRLDVVPFSVDFVTLIATDTAPGLIATPITSPYIIEGSEYEFFIAERRFTAVVGGIDASALKSLVWKLQLDDGSAPVSRIEGLVGQAAEDGQEDAEQAAEDGQEDAEAASMTYSQNFEFSDTGTLTVTATNSDGVTVQNSLTVFVDLPALEGDTPASRAASAAQLFQSDEYNNSQYQTVALIYKTLTGQWPTQTQLETGKRTISEETTTQSSQTTVPLNGSITTGGTQTLSFDYSEGDEVTISVTGDGTNANPLLDSTLTVSAPDGSFVGFSDDNFNLLTGILSFDSELSFTASQTGTYTATVGGYSVFQSGDFAIESVSTTIESNIDILAARALVESLKGVYNGANGFLADSAAGSSVSSAFVAQIYRNKHEVGITAFNTSLLSGRLRGVDIVKSTGDIMPGYQSNVVDFVADFALDVDLATGPYASATTGDGYPYSGTVYYGRPNNPLSSWDQARAEIQSDANLNSALSALLGIQNPTDLDLAPYVGMTLEEALVEIFAADQYVGFAAATDSFVAKRMVDLGIVDGNKAGANDDADGDGVSNIAEILLNSDPLNTNDGPTASGSSSMDGTDFVFEFVRLKPSLTPSGASVGVECSDGTFSFMPVDDIESKLSSDGIDQSGIDSDYEKVEFRVDTNEVECGFFRLKVE